MAFLKKINKYKNLALAIKLILMLCNKNQDKIWMHYIPISRHAIGAMHSKYCHQFSERLYQTICKHANARCATTNSIHSKKKWKIIFTTSTNIKFLAFKQLKKKHPKLSWKGSAVSASPSMPCAPAPWPSWWPLLDVAQCPSCAVAPKSGYSTHNAISPVPDREQ